ncbi:MAG: hypothetical protein WBI18_01630 [Candidatus Saccharicenans sp.]
MKTSSCLSAASSPIPIGPARAPAAAPLIIAAPVDPGVPVIVPVVKPPLKEVQNLSEAREGL